MKPANFDDSCAPSSRSKEWDCNPYRGVCVHASGLKLKIKRIGPSLGISQIKLCVTTVGEIPSTMADWEKDPEFKGRLTHEAKRIMRGALIKTHIVKPNKAERERDMVRSWVSIGGKHKPSDKWRKSIYYKRVNCIANNPGLHQKKIWVNTVFGVKTFEINAAGKPDIDQGEINRITKQMKVGAIIVIEEIRLKNKYVWGFYTQSGITTPLTNKEIKMYQIIKRCEDAETLYLNAPGIGSAIRRYKITAVI